DAAVKMMTPSENTRRRPYRSPAAPPASISAPSVSVYALRIHCEPRTDVFRSACRSGRATLATEPSMNAMLDPRIVAARAQRFADCAQPEVAGTEARMTPSSHAVRVRLSMGCVQQGAFRDDFQFARLECIVA